MWDLDEHRRKLFAAVYGAWVAREVNDSMMPRGNRPLDDVLLDAEFIHEAAVKVATVFSELAVKPKDEEE